MIKMEKEMTLQTQKTEVSQSTWNGAAELLQQKKEALKEIRREMRVQVVHRSPLESVIGSADFYGLITSALSTSRTGAIKCRFAGMAKSAIVRSESIGSDVVVRFYKAAREERDKINPAILTDKGVKLDSYTFEYLPATDAEAKQQ
jgi:hypothetical protein